MTKHIFFIFSEFEIIGDGRYNPKYRGTNGFIYSGILISSKVDRSCITSIVNIVNTEYPFRLPSFSFFFLWGKGGPDIQSVIIRKPLFVSKTVVRNYQTLKLKLTYGVICRLSCLKNKIRIERNIISSCNFDFLS